MSSARDRILKRLHDTRPEMSYFSERDHHSQFNWDKQECIHRFTERMEAVRTQVIRADKATWLDQLTNICEEKGLRNLLASPETDYGKLLYDKADTLSTTLLPYDKPIEQWKDELFNRIDAGFTTTLGGIAETGTLILWPSIHEPRLMSLVPPVHIAILDTQQLYSTFAEAMKQQNWVARGMPTNALLVSGCSKSADIEQTLAYGVHGPKELIVILV